MPLEEALPRLAATAMRIAHAPSQLERRPRAVAIGTFDGVHRGHRSVLRAAIDSGLEPTVITLDPHPRIVLGNRVDLISTLERRLELLAEAGVADTLVAAFTPEFMRLSPDEFIATYLTSIGAEAVAVGEDFRFGHRRSDSLETLRAAGLELLAGDRGRGRLVERRARCGPRRRPRGCSGDARPALRARRHGRRRRPARRNARLPDGEHRDGPAASLPALRDLRRRGACAPRSCLDRRRTRTTAAPSDASSRTSSTSTATSTASGSSSSSGRASATRRSSRAKRH